MTSPTGIVGRKRTWPADITPLSRVYNAPVTGPIVFDQPARRDSYFKVRQSIQMNINTGSVGGGRKAAEIGIIPCPTARN